jgi:hypothetical protein
LRFEEGKQATENADDYVLVTLFFAVVLFFAGISLRFDWLPMRVRSLVLAAFLLAYGAIRIARCPSSEGWATLSEPNAVRPRPQAGGACLGWGMQYSSYSDEKAFPQVSDLLGGRCPQ